MQEYFPIMNGSARGISKMPGVLWTKESAKAEKSTMWYSYGCHCCCLTSVLIDTWLYYTQFFFVPSEACMEWFFLPSSVILLPSLSHWYDNCAEPAATQERVTEPPRGTLMREALEETITGRPAWWWQWWCLWKVHQWHFLYVIICGESEH